MYLPKLFEMTDKAVLTALMREHSFATLVTHGEAGLLASHVPVLYSPERGPQGVLAGHVARANPHWQQLHPDREVLVIFQGPHAYVSPSWYQTKLAVPTWNYVAIHTYGRPRLLENEQELEALLHATVGQYESGRPAPWKFEPPTEYKAAQMKAIVGFEIEVTRVEGKFKLNQNRKPEDIAGVIEALSQSERPMERELAMLMRNYYQERGPAT